MEQNIDKWLRELRTWARDKSADAEFELEVIELMVEAARVQQKDEHVELLRLRVQIVASQAAQSSLLVENMRLRDEIAALNRHRRAD